MFRIPEFILCINQEFADLEFDQNDTVLFSFQCKLITDFVEDKKFTTFVQARVFCGLKGLYILCDTDKFKVRQLVFLYSFHCFMIA